MNDFQKTVNLRQSEEERDRPEKQIKKKIKKVIKERSRAEAIDQVYNDKTEEIEAQKEMHTISRPESRPSYESLYKRIVMILAFVIIAGAVYFLFIQDKTPKEKIINENELEWFAVTLDSDEVYFGQLVDVGSDPIEIKNVFYNYDQLNPETDENTVETSNLRLVKRGNETYGPNGTMYIVRSHVVFMEQLKEESKVRKAILDYQN